MFFKLKKLKKPTLRVLVWEKGCYGLNWFPEGDYEVLKETDEAYLLKGFGIHGDRWVTKDGPFKKCELVKPAVSLIDKVT